jgi:hypothetical protein
MKAYVEQLWLGSRKYRARVQQGCQYFTIGEGDKDHCDFLVKMFTSALGYHDAAVAQLAEQSICTRQVADSISASGSNYHAVPLDKKYNFPWGQ